MTRDAIRAAITFALGAHAIRYFDTATDPRADGVSLNTDALTFDRLAALSVALDTKDINIIFDEGFEGSTETPPDGASVRLYIRGIP